MNIPWAFCLRYPCLYCVILASTVSQSRPPPPQEILQNPQVVLAQASLSRVPVHRKVCVHPARVESLFPLVLWNSCSQAPVAFKARCSEGSSWCQTSRLGSLLLLSHFSHVWLFAALQTVASQAPLSMGILQARILEWVAMPFSRGSSWPRDQTLKVPQPLGGWVSSPPDLCQLCSVTHQGSEPSLSLVFS